MGIFVNDKAWNLKQVRDRQENGEWHLKRAQEALKKGDMSAYNDHMARSKPYFKEAEDYRRAAKLSTK